MIELPGIDPKMIANNLIPSDPVHPGEILLEELECRGISPDKLAEDTGIKTSIINDIINGKRYFTMEYAMIIEAALGIEADFWMNLQLAYDKGKAQHDQSFMERLAKIRKVAAVL